MTSPNPTTGQRDHLDVDVDGPVHVLDFGGTARDDVATIVLVHGLDGSAANWWDVGPTLAGQVRTFALDLPGFGRTPLAGRKVTMAAFADQAIAVARAHTGTDGPFHLVGSSMGGAVVLLAAARHPDLVARVSLVAPAVPRAGSGPIAWSFLPWVLPFWLGIGSAESRRRMSLDPDRRVRGLLRLCYAPGSTTSPEALAEMVEVAAERDRRDAVRAWTGAARDLFTWLLRRGRFHRMAARITAPVHFIEGAADPIIPASSALDAVQRHGWQHTRLAGVGHAPMLESPEPTLRAILDGTAADGNPRARGDVA